MILNQYETIGELKSQIFRVPLVIVQSDIKTNNVGTYTGLYWYMVRAN